MYIAAYTYLPAWDKAGYIISPAWLVQACVADNCRLYVAGHICHVVESTLDYYQLVLYLCSGMHFVPIDPAVV
jgi:hypothetical protein